MQALRTPADAAQWLRGRVSGGLTSDSRTVRPGDGFIAWPGAATDGRRFVDAAVRQGAAACLVEKDGLEGFAFREDSQQSTAAYLHLKAATGPIASEFFEAPSQSLEVIAITGTNGKTSTAWWLAQALCGLPKPWSLPCALVGTLGIGKPTCAPAKDGGESGSGIDLVANGLTTPDPVLLQRSLRGFVAQGVKACAVEASSIGLVEHRLAGTRINVAVFTNFTQDHLDYHGSMDAYWRAKESLFAWRGLRTAVINVDDAKGRGLAERLLSADRPAPLDIWTFSCSGPARLQATDIRYDGTGLRFSVKEGGEAVQLSTRLIGQYNVSNLLGVIGVMRALGVSLRDCVLACASLSPVPGRMQCMGEAGGPLVVVDFAHTPDALEKTLEALRPLTETRSGALWCVFGCGGNRDAVKRPLMGAVAGRLSDHVIVTSDNPRDESAQDIIDQIAAGLGGHRSMAIHADRALAISTAVLRADNRDVVLVAGKGHEDYQEIHGRKMPFSDPVHVAAALKNRMATQQRGLPTT